MKRVSALFVIFILWTGTALAAHPLITDDTGTQGKGKFQLELNGEVSFDEETSDGVAVEETASELAAVGSYGITEEIDIVVGMPYQWTKAEGAGSEVFDETGVSDMSIELKWRFYDNDGLSLAMKPAVSLPTGDEQKGLGNGRASYGVTFITTKSSGPWEFHFNLGYARNEYELEEDEAANRKDVWHVSFAPALEVADGLTAVANIGIERSPDKTSDTHPAFVLGGLIYAVSENLDIDAGIKAGLNKPEADTTILAGMALRF